MRSWLPGRRLPQRLAPAAGVAPVGDRREDRLRRGELACPRSRRARSGRCSRAAPGPRPPRRGARPRTQRGRRRTPPPPRKPSRPRSWPPASLDGDRPLHERVEQAVGTCRCPACPNVTLPEPGSGAPGTGSSRPLFQNPLPWRRRRERRRGARLLARVASRSGRTSTPSKRLRELPEVGVRLASPGRPGRRWRCGSHGEPASHPEGDRRADRARSGCSGTIPKKSTPPSRVAHDAPCRRRLRRVREPLRRLDVLRDLLRARPPCRPSPTGSAHPAA